ncbi:MAG: hypothetical protein AAGD00_06490 [Planctomycetota bacterium]
MPAAQVIASPALAVQMTVVVHDESVTVLPWVFLALLAALAAVVVVTKPLRVMSRRRLAIVVGIGVLVPVLGTIFAIAYLAWTIRKPALIVADH